jgi:hypothetical protein
VSTVHCGLDTYLSGYPDPAIDHLCRHAYAPHAHVLFVALGALVLGLIAAAHLWRWSWRGVAYGLLGVLVVAVAVDALRPVRVGVGGGAIASCGLDSYVAGYPDHTVQVACGAHLSTHALGLLAAALVAVVGLIAVRMIGSPLLGSGRRHEA